MYWLSGCRIGGRQHGCHEGRADASPECQGKVRSTGGPPQASPVPPPCPFGSLLPPHNLSYGASRPDTPAASRSAGSKSPYSPFTNRTTFSCTASAMRRFETRPRSRCRISPSSSFRRRFTKSRTRPALRDPYRGLNLCRSSLVLTLMGTRGLTRRGCFCWASTHRCCLVPAF